jgi:hypothetical protein
MWSLANALSRKYALNNTETKIIIPFGVCEDWSKSLAG